MSDLRTNELIVESEATASTLVNVKIHKEAALGNGPVNAVDTTIRKALSQTCQLVSDFELIDCKVQMLLHNEQSSGTGAKTCVQVNFSASKEQNWRTVGVCTNIIDASVIVPSNGPCGKLLQAGVTI